MHQHSRLSLIIPALGMMLVGMLLLVVWMLSTPHMGRTDDAALPVPVEDVDPVSVAVGPDRVTQGGIVFVRITAPEATRVHLFDGKQTREAHRGAVEGTWEVTLGVERDATPGARDLTARAFFPDTSLTASAQLRVEKRDFGRQHLRMSSSEESKYQRVSVQEEYRLMRAAIGQETPRRFWRGAFDLPTDGRISTKFGIQRYRNGQKVSIHKGIDIAAPKGTLIHAANDGTVILRRDFGMHGRTIVIDHGGGVVGIYLHLNDFGVSEGQTVTKGQKIGRVGRTGVATGPHLHYALYVHGVPVDPLLWREVPAGW